MRMEEKVEMYFSYYKEIANFWDFVGQQKKDFYCRYSVEICLCVEYTHFSLMK